MRSYVSLLSYPHPVPVPAPPPPPLLPPTPPPPTDTAADYKSFFSTGAAPDTES